jgi:uncharacterized protein
MTFGVLADVHGNFEAMSRAMRRHPDVPFWLCVGDLASRAGAYPEPPVPLYWIKGNNENFDAIEAFVTGVGHVPNLHYIPNGTAIRVGDLNVAGLGGTFAPTQYDTPAARLSHGTPKRRPVGNGGTVVVRDDKRRHFVREEVEALERIRDVDVLLTHEGAFPLRIVPEHATAPRPISVGKRPVSQLIAALRPRLHLCGHHHRFAAVTTREGVPSICLDRVSRSYLLVDRRTFEWQKVDQADA